MKMEDLRPAFLTDQCGLGGGETSLLNLLKGLQTSGVTPILVCPAGSLLEEAIHKGVKAVPLEFPAVHLRAGWLPFFSIRTVLRLCRIIAKHGINVVHAESLLGVYYGGMAAWLCQRSCVATFHGFWHIDSCLARFFLRTFCRRIFPVSATTAAEMRPVFATRPWMVRVLPLDVDAQFAADLLSRAQARAHFGFPDDSFVILHPARFQRIKAQHIVLEAIARIVAARPPIPPLAIFAGAPTEPGTVETRAYADQIKTRANLPDIAPYVRFIGPTREVATLMRAADVVVSPSSFETFGMTVIEALCVGTPVIVTSVGGTAELVQHGINGALIPPEDPAALAAELADAMANPAARTQTANMARAAALLAYGPGRRAATLINEYRSLTRTRAPR